MAGPEDQSRGEGSLLKRQKRRPTTSLSCHHRSFAERSAHMGYGVSIGKPRAKAYAGAMRFFVRLSLWQSSGFMAFQKRFLTPVAF